MDKSLEGRKNFLESSPFIATCRPRQWVKNLLVFAAPLFSFRLDVDVWRSSSGALVAFCLISSAIYFVNDLLDVEDDRAHPRKRFRPIAAGLIRPRDARLCVIALISLSLLTAAFIAPAIVGLVLLYSLIHCAYCLRLKNEPLLDLFCIAAGFLLRAIAGAIAAGLQISPWFLLTVGLLALFLALEKRKAELRVAIQREVFTRPVLARYSLPLLLRLESLVATSSFITYSLWAAGPALNGADTSWMLLTVPFVLIGIFRYQLLSDPDEAGRRKNYAPVRTSESPEEILFGDKGIQLTLIGWLLTTIVIGLRTQF